MLLYLGCGIIKNYVESDNKGEGDGKRRKVAQIKKNNNIHITVGGDPKNWQVPYMNIQAEASVSTDLETKKKCWSDMLKQFFSGPEDPNYAVIKISPQVIEYMSPGAHEPEIYVAD